MGFKPGDKIAVYDGPGRLVARVVSVDERGSVLAEYRRVGTERLRALWHPKQCRKIVKKKRRKLVANVSATGELIGAYISSSSPLGYFHENNEVIRFIEEIKREHKK